MIYPLQASLKSKIASGINPTENYRPYDRLFSFQQAINPSPKRKSRSMTVLPVLKQMPGLYIRRETSSIFALLLGVYSGRQNGLPPKLGDKNKLCNCMLAVSFSDAYMVALLPVLKFSSAKDDCQKYSVKIFGAIHRLG